RDFDDGDVGIQSTENVAAKHRNVINLEKFGYAEATLKAAPTEDIAKISAKDEQQW
ncbi:hypothetical protein ACLOJK_022325, partial [Asimina triloba]